MMDMIADFLDMITGARKNDTKWELFFASHREFIHGPYHGGQKNVMFLERKDAVMEPRRVTS